MVHVFLTVDTEAWPFDRAWPRVPLAPRSRIADEVAHYLYGITESGEFGVRYQIARLNEFGLKGTFFVEALSADIIGCDELARLIALIETGSQEVQLQIHTEWLGEVPVNGSDLPRAFRQNLREFSYEQQCTIVAHGLENLRRCGARDVVAMRAGNFGANLDTLRAARANGLLFDSSHDFAYLGTNCGLSELGSLLGPRRVEGIVEVPMSFFHDYGNHVRHAQICACSADELKDALMWAWRERWPSFVILLHSFELIQRHRGSGKRIGPHGIHLARFEALCRFLDENRDKFRTTHFREFPPTLFGEATARPLRSTLHRTLYRYGEQAISRIV